jgi:phospholipid/cholesterol/gamma-HCH transport system substrate-binding protein
MNESIHRHSVVVGFFVLIGMAILVAGVLLIGNLNRSLQKKTKLVAYFDDVNGLQKGNFIWFSGVRIGAVKNLYLRGTSGVEVVMDIDDRIKQYIRKDSRVKLGSDGLIGNRILVIYGGSETVSSIEEGDTLRFEKTLATDDLISTLQQNNENLKAITGDFKIISRKLARGEGTLGKLLNDNSVYINLNSAVASIQGASVQAQQLINSFSDFSSGLKKEGTLAYGLTSDTIVFYSLKASILKLRQIADTATLIINNLKMAESNPNTTVGVLLHDENTGVELKETIKNLNKSTEKLNVDLEALQHSFLLKGYFKDKANTPK